METPFEKPIMNGEDGLVQPSAIFENEHMRFLGYKISNTYNQEIEYHFFIKSLPAKGFYLFEHIINKNTGRFYPKDWQSFPFSLGTRTVEEVWRIKVQHSLQEGEYEFWIGFAAQENTNERLVFPETKDNRILLGTIKFTGEDKPSSESEAEPITISRKELNELAKIKS